MMQRRSHRLRLAALTSAAVIGLGLVGSTPALAGGNHSWWHSEVVARGLDNPRQLSSQVRHGPSASSPRPVRRTRGVHPGSRGRGRVHRAHRRGHQDQGAHQSRVLSKLPSLAAEGGGGAIGPSDVHLTRFKRITVTVGMGADPRERPRCAPAATGLSGTSRHGVRLFADQAAWESTRTPSTRSTATRPGSAQAASYVVADAGGNTVLQFGHRGVVTLLAEFENRLVPAPLSAPDPEVPDAAGADVGRDRARTAPTTSAS